MKARDRPAPELFAWRSKIPVPYPTDYHTLIAAAHKAKFEPIYLQVPCPNEKCTSLKTLRLKPWFVERNCVLFDPAGVAIYKQTPVPLALCDECHCRIRVLPVEILPGKTFSLPIIENACHHYATCEDGLRQTVQKIPGVAPHYSTLHGWLGGIGERALDRVQLKINKAAIGKPSLPPTATLVAETAKRQDLDLIKRWNKTKAPMASGKYKTVFRKELLQACLKLLWMAASLFQNSSYPLSMWQQVLISIFNVPAWLFASRNLHTLIQLTDLTENVIILDSKKTAQRAPP